MRYATLLLTLMVSTANADELILTNGKRLAWKTLTDNGDSYTVEGEDGRRTMIAKSDVERIEKAAPPQPPPLAGAAFTLDKKAISVNLLQALDVKKGAVAGTWKLEKGALVGVSDAAANSRLEFPMEVPEEYDLTIDVSRKEGLGDFDIGLVAGGKQFIVAFDAVNRTLSGIGYIGGQSIEQHRKAVKGPFFVDDKPRSIVCMVRKEALIVQVDGKDFLSYADGWDKLSNHAAHEVRSAKVPFLVIWKGTFSVSRVLLRYPKPNP